MSPIRVLHFARVVNRHDFIDTVLRFADPRRFRMAACTLTRATNIEAPEYERVGLPAWSLELPPRALGRVVPCLARLLRRERIHVLHTHHFEEGIAGVLAARIARTPAVVIGRHFHDEHYLLASGAKLRALLAGEALAHGLARLVIVPSAAIRNLLVTRQKVPPSKVRVVPYGFDFQAERYRPAPPGAVAELRRELGLTGTVVIGNAGRHHRLKGHAVLLRALADLGPDPSVRLVLAGDGPETPALRALARDLGLEARVAFLGWRRDVPRLLPAMDVVAHPTLHEAFSQLMVEALAHARPLVMSRVSGAEDVLGADERGVLVPPGNPAALAAAIRWVLDHYDVARERAEAAQRHVRTALDIRAVVCGYEAAYEAALDGGPAG